MNKYLIAGTFIGLLFPFAAFASLDTDLHYGSTGQDVTALQEFLKQQGVFSGQATGNFFSLTLAAVKKFQSAEGITPISGYVGPITRGVINQILAGQVTNSEGSATATQPPVDLSQQASTTAPAQGNSSSLIQSLLAQLAALNDKINSLQQTQQQLASSTQATVQNTQQIVENTTPTPPPPITVIVQAPPEPSRPTSITVKTIGPVPSGNTNHPEYPYLFVFQISIVDQYSVPLNGVQVAMAGTNYNGDTMSISPVSTIMGADGSWYAEFRYWPYQVASGPGHIDARNLTFTSGSLTKTTQVTF